MKRKKINKKIIIVMLLLFISIGFAYLTTNLGINGISIIRKTVWDVHFENIINENEDVLSIDTPAVISNNKLRVDFEVTLDQPGQEYSFYVDVINNSTFDVMVDTVTISGLTTAQEKWIKPIVTYSDGISPQKYDVLKENSKEVFRVSVKYSDDLTASELPTSNNDFNISIEITYTQTDSNAKERNHIEFVNQHTPGEISVGDEISIGTEHFYVVSTNSDTTTLFAKYNLYVGNIYSNSTTKEGEITENDEGYCLQNSLARGFTGDDRRVGGVPFSTINYWNDNGTISKDYGGTSQFTNNVFDSSYNSASGDNYSVAYYIEYYINLLNRQGANYISGRLITFQELLDLGCVYTSYPGNCRNVPEGNEFVYSSGYWTSTASGYSGLWNMSANATFGGHNYIGSKENGVRPIIEVPTSHLPKTYKITFNPNGGTMVSNEVYYKKILDNLEDNYYTTFFMNYSPSIIRDTLDYSVITDNESPTGTAYRFYRNDTNPGSSACAYYRKSLHVGEPYYIEFIAKGKGYWRLDHEQSSAHGRYTLNETYKKYTEYIKAWSNQNYIQVAICDINSIENNYVNIASAKIIHQLPEVSREGYTFGGWYTDPESGDRIDRDTVVKNDTTYYAHWTEN